MDQEKDDNEKLKEQNARETGNYVEVNDIISTVYNDISKIVNRKLTVSAPEKESDSEAIISISGFKRIRDRIRISDLGIVNYFVGRNGSGKSSVLWAVAALNNPEIAKRYIQGKGEIILVDRSEVNIVTETGSSKANNTQRVSTFAHWYGKGNPQDPETGAMVFDYNLDKMGRHAEEPFSAMNSILEDLKEQEIKVVRPNGDFSPDIGFSHDGYRVNLIDLADGLKVMIELNHFLNGVRRAIYDIDITKRSGCFYVLMEEPENHLHPSYQKLVPELFKKYAEEISVKLKAHIRFFVTTHSPFVIGAASQIKDQKVYILDDGKLVSYDAEKHITTETAESSGYTGSTCAWVVSRMLGADVVDFGYPENYCLLEENSLYQLLKACAEKGILANYQFISAGGLAKEVGLESTMNELSKLETLIKCNPYYWNIYRVILDNTNNDKIAAKVKERVKKIKDRLGSRFTELSKDNLEDYYESIDPELFKEAKGRIAEAPDSDSEGRIKAEYARRIADLVVNEQDFTRLFGGELDFLLKKGVG